MCVGRARGRVGGCGVVCVFGGVVRARGRGRGRGVAPFVVNSLCWQWRAATAWPHKVHSLAYTLTSYWPASNLPTPCCPGTPHLGVKGVAAGDRQHFGRKVQRCTDGTLVPLQPRGTGGEAKVCGRRGERLLMVERRRDSELQQCTLGRRCLGRLGPARRGAACVQRTVVPVQHTPASLMIGILSPGPLAIRMFSSLMSRLATLCGAPAESQGVQ